MRHPIVAFAVLGGFLSAPQPVAPEISRWRMGGANGHDWGDWARVNTMIDVETSPGSIQPFELHPEENLLLRLGPWARWRNPRNPLWRAGEPRIWRWLGTRAGTVDWEPRLLLDGDPFTGFAAKSYRAVYVSLEYYTLDLGAPAPVERFRTIPKEGVDELSGEPYRPGFAQRNFAVSGGDESDLSSVDNEIAYAPLPALLAYVENNVHFEAEVRFPLQYLRLIRYRAFHDLGEDVFADMARQEPPKQARYGLGELELYGRGFVPKATWESRVIDLGEMSNVGQVHFGLSRWRREEDDYVPDREARVDARIELKSGLDDTPTTYYTYDAMGKLAEASEETYVNKLQTRQHPWHPAGIGWRGSVGADTDNWSFWTAPLGESGESPRLPRGKYFKVRVRLETQGLYEFARMESLVVVSSPVLAERIVGEVAAAGQLQPVGNLAQVSAGESTELIYHIRAEFSGPVQSGFDAVRVRMPGDTLFLGLEMGDPPAAVLPDSIVEEASGLAVYLPRRIDSTGDGHLRLRLQTTLYDAAADLPAEAFARDGEFLPQAVEPGDASSEVGTDQLRILALAASLDDVLGPVDVTPRLHPPGGPSQRSGRDHLHPVQRALRPGRGPRLHGGRQTREPALFWTAERRSPAAGMGWTGRPW